MPDVGMKIDIKIKFAHLEEGLADTSQEKRTGAEATRQIIFKMATPAPPCHPYIIKDVIMREAGGQGEGSTGTSEDKVRTVPATLARRLFNYIGCERLGRHLNSAQRLPRERIIEHEFQGIDVWLLHPDTPT